MQADNWEILKKFTNARINLGLAGNSLPTNNVLALRMSHALAKDALYTELDVTKLEEEIEKISLHSLVVQSQISSKNEYLINPNKGRILDDVSAENLINCSKKSDDVCIIIADGLSAEAVNSQAMNLIQDLIPKLQFITIAPIIIAKYSRVAISDEIGELMNSKIALILIGERPGLSSPTSMSAYITFDPKKGNTDEKRNCVSNIQQHGLPIEFAATKIAYLINEMLKRKLSGVDLKDNFSDYYISE
jgi:ethanolamine ammonia-lyase small subunit